LSYPQIPVWQASAFSGYELWCITLLTFCRVITKLKFTEYKAQNRQTSTISEHKASRNTNIPHILFHSKLCSKLSINTIVLQPVFPIVLKGGLYSATKISIQDSKKPHRRSSPRHRAHSQTVAPQSVATSISLSRRKLPNTSPIKHRG
jgi:hypothetical protein